MKIYLFFLPLLLALCLNAAAMEKQLPQEKKEASHEITKVPSKKIKLLEEENEESIKEPKFSWDIQNQDRNGQFEYKHEVAPSAQELSAFERLPNEIKELIISFLVTANGIDDRTRLHNAVQNIRNLMLTSKGMKSFFDDIYLHGYLIKELAQRYTNGNVIAAAAALATKIAGQWLQAQPEDEVVRENSIDILINASKNNDYGTINFLLSFVAPKITKQLSFILPQIIDAGLHEQGYTLNPQIVERFLMAGASVKARDTHGETALAHAVAVAQKIQNQFPEKVKEKEKAKVIKVIQLLLQAGSDIFQKDVWGHSAFMGLPYIYDDAIGVIIKEALATRGYAQADLDVALQEAIIWASRSDMREIIHDLLQAGANPNATDGDGDTTFTLALSLPEVTTDLITVLIKAGAHVNGINEFGQTPLMFYLMEVPYQHNTLAILQLLLDAGANVQAKDNDGDTIEDYIMQKSEAEGWGPEHKKAALELLRKFGLKEGHED